MQLGAKKPSKDIDHPYKTAVLVYTVPWEEAKGGGREGHRNTVSLENLNADIAARDNVLSNHNWCSSGSYLHGFNSI